MPEAAKPTSRTAASGEGAESINTARRVVGSNLQPHHSPFTLQGEGTRFQG